MISKQQEDIKAVIMESRIILTSSMYSTLLSVFKVASKIGLLLMHLYLARLYK